MRSFDKAFTHEGFSLERLRRLTEVMEHEYIARAAGQDRTLANQISRQIGELEGFFEIPLRRREGKLAKLNERGKELARITEGFFGALQDFQDKLDGQPQTVVLGAGQAYIDTLVLPGLKYVRQATDGARIVVKNLRSRRLVEGVSADELDLAVVSEKRIAGKKFESRKLRTLNYLLFVPKEWAKEVKRGNPVEAIFDLPFATLEGTGELRSSINQIALNAGKELQLELECTSLTQVATAVKCGACCGILPDFFEGTISDKEVVSYRLSDLKGLRRKIFLIWKPSVLEFKPRIVHAIDAIEKIFKP